VLNALLPKRNTLTFSHIASVTKKSVQQSPAGSLFLSGGWTTQSPAAQRVAAMASGRGLQA
jgi:hypothetical protein